jgi:FixJ family two-component response regulator
MSTERKSVVVVDDDDSINRAVKRLLLAAGFNTETFSSAEALLEAGAVERAGCLVLDMRLPGMSGFELYDKLSGEGTSPPVIFMTSHDENGARQRAEKALAVAFLPKPFPGASLVSAVTEALACNDKSGQSERNNP